MRPITPQGLALIARFEGFSPVLYFCPAGYATIGYGHRVRAGEEFSGGISEAEAWALLSADAHSAAAAVNRLIHCPLTDGQYDALVSFTFNVGAGALQRSALRRCVNRGEHDAVPAQLRRWVWAGGIKHAGLLARRQAEAARYRQRD